MRWDKQGMAQASKTLRGTSPKSGRNKTWLDRRMWLLGGSNNKWLANMSHSQGKRDWQKIITFIQKSTCSCTIIRVYGTSDICDVLCSSSVIVYMLSGRKLDGLVQIQPLLAGLLKLWNVSILPALTMVALVCSTCRPVVYTQSYMYMRCQLSNISYKTSISITCELLSMKH